MADGAERKIRRGNEVFFGVNESESQRLIRSTISGLAHTRVVTDQFREAGATWLAGRNGSLDMIFAKQGGGFAGLNVFGSREVIGMKVVGDVSRFAEERARLLARNSELAYMVRQKHGNIILLTPAELYDWWQFYRQIEAMGIYDRLGARAAEFSGLERTTQEKLSNTKLILEKLFAENGDYFSQFGVVKVRESGTLDLAFLAKDGGLVEVPLSWVKTFRIDGQIMVDTVSRKRMIVGIIFPKEGESKREMEVRARELEMAYEARHKVSIQVARATPGQVGLWKKLGFGVEASAAIAEAELTPGDVAQFLYMGRSNVDSGPLARKLNGRLPKGGYLSLPGQGDEYSFPGADLLFLQRNNGRPEYALVNGLAALNPRLDRRGKFGVTPMSNVLGIKIFPNSWSFNQMKDDLPTKELVRQLRRYTLNPSANVLFLNQALFEYWQAQGTPFSAEEQSKQFADDPGRAVSYGYGLTGEGKQIVSVMIPQKEPRIGGVNLVARVRRGADSIVTLWDAGLGFEDAPMAFGQLGNKERTASGMRRGLMEGEITMIPGVLDLDKMLKSLEDYWAITDPAVLARMPVGQFLASEVSQRMKPTDIRAYLPGGIAEAVISEGPKYVHKWGEGKTVPAAILISHAHLDHVGNLPFMDPAIPIYIPSDQAAVLDYLTNKAPSWRDRMTNTAMLMETKAGAAYQKVERDIRVHYRSGRIPLFSNGKDGGQVYTPIRVNHSLGSDAGILETMVDGEKVVLCFTGDIKKGEESDAAVQKIGSVHRPQVIITETTNIGNHKPGEGRTENDVRDSIYAAVRESGGAGIVVVADPKNLERMRNLYEIAGDTGRRLAVAYQHAEFQRQLITARELAPVGAIGYKDVFTGEMGKDWTIWANTMTRERRFQGDLKNLAARGPLGILDSQRLSRESEKWMVVVSPYSILQDQFVNRFPDGLAIIYSASYPYATNQKLMMGANLAPSRGWLSQVGVKRVYGDMKIHGQGGRVDQKLMDKKRIFHVSGHVSERELIAYLDTMIGDRHGEKVAIIPIHGFFPETAAELFYKKLGRRRVVVLSQNSRYNPNAQNPYATISEFDLSGPNRWKPTIRTK